MEYDMRSHEKKLEVLETLLRDQLLTPTKTVDNDTLICLTELLPDGGVNYHQAYFQSLPPMLKDALFGQTKGFRVGPYKVVAVFDLWDFGWGYITKWNNEGN
jgi:hypothetical protein